MRVRIDEDLCIACGACESLCPAGFRIGERKVAEVLADACEDRAACVLQAAEGCPQAAILVDEAYGVRVVLARTPPHNRGLAVTG
jgi:ferredoxin